MGVPVPAASELTIGRLGPRLTFNLCSHPPNPESYTETGWSLTTLTTALPLSNRYHHHRLSPYPLLCSLTHLLCSLSLEVGHRPLPVLFHSQTTFPSFNARNTRRLSPLTVFAFLSLLSRRHSNRSPSRGRFPLTLVWPFVSSTPSHLSQPCACSQPSPLSWPTSNCPILCARHHLAQPFASLQSASFPPLSNSVCCLCEFLSYLSPCAASLALALASLPKPLSKLPLYSLFRLLPKFAKHVTSFSFALSLSSVLSRLPPVSDRVESSISGSTL